MSKERIFPAPPANVEYEEFWSKANNGKLLLPRCMDTNQFFWYPRKISPFTLSANVELVEAAGKGVIYTFSVMRRANPQYVIAYVRLVEGVTMMTNIVECDPDSLEIGQPVELLMQEAENGQKIPVFRPV